MASLTNQMALQIFASGRCVKLATQIMAGDDDGPDPDTCAALALMSDAIVAGETDTDQIALIGYTAYDVAQRAFLSSMLDGQWPGAVVAWCELSEPDQAFWLGMAGAAVTTLTLAGAIEQGPEVD